MNMVSPGSVTILGSGETSTSGGKIFEALAQNLAANAPSVPLEISILETPAGFETNTQRVAGRVADFLKVRLHNYHPQVHLIPARKKGTAYSPDSPEVVQPLYSSQMIFMGPGSPTYAVRQLENSLTWQVVQARHRLGASLVFASAATIALGMLALPVYEIYKVGEDPHWKTGLDFFKPFGLSLVIVPHWNNHEGGEEVDTSHCFIGQERFAALKAILPDHSTIVGIDEHTSLTIDFETHRCLVRGTGEIHLLKGDQQEDCSAGCSYPAETLGDYHPITDPQAGLSETVWQQALSGLGHQAAGEPLMVEIPIEIQRLVEDRQKARQQRDWSLADEIRGQIARLGWEVQDTPGGPVVQHQE